ncbi:MAG TPA: hypothetical protein VEH82_03155 [Acidimicrobiales bacterium]|nr:hypothetical protein [Acidimicrobiales bacterium]
MFLKKEGIEVFTDASVEYVDTDAVRLTSGQYLPFRFSMLIPPFMGQDLVAKSGLSDPKG